MSSLKTLAREAKAAAAETAVAGTERKDTALKAMAARLLADMDGILKANDMDLHAARLNGLSDAMCERLTLNEERIRNMADGILAVMAQNDPIGEVLDGCTRPNGLKIKHVRVPLGVVGIIFESRPNVTSDAAALCIKAGNACVLRGGKEAINSNLSIAASLQEGLAEAGLPKSAICMVSDTSRESAAEMMRLNGLIDVLIPRGGAGLIKAVVENSSLPVIETGSGNCHLYIDSEADADMAADIAENAKCSRPSVCNSVETLLIHKDRAAELLPVIQRRFAAYNVVWYGCEQTRAILKDALPVTEEHYYTEFNDFTIACRIVDSIQDAVRHIRRYSSGHSECIVTDSCKNADYFTSAIDSAAVYVNASTRFTDGGEFGLGAEIGISTQKLHARGPMGILALTSGKYIISGGGQIR